MIHFSGKLNNSNSKWIAHFGYGLPKSIHNRCVDNFSPVRNDKDEMDF